MKLVNTFIFVMWSPVGERKGFHACTALSCAFLHMYMIRPGLVADPG